MFQTTSPQLTWRPCHGVGRLTKKLAIRSGSRIIVGTGKTSHNFNAMEVQNGMFYEHSLYIYISIYIYIYDPVFRPRGPPPRMGWVSRSHPRSLLFASYWQHFWLPASHLLGTCYPLDDLRSTHTPSKYLRATYSHIYMCYVSNSYK